MKTKAITTIMLTLFLASMLSMAFNVTPASATTLTDVYVSDTDDSWWAGATSGNIDGSGYIVPPNDAVWSSAVFCWEHSSWNPTLNPAGLKAKLFASPSADWIWKASQVTTGESYTGDIAFFKKQINIPDNAFNIQAQLFVITADNVYYFYVNDDWSGTPVGIANFAPGYGPTSFYYVADGTDKSGGDNSVPYETLGNLYPLEASMGWPQAGNEQWWNIEQWSIGSLQQGVNWLQIVAINEHAPPGGSGEINPAGLIYKVEVTYELATIEKTVEPDSGYLGDIITVTLTVEVPTGLTMTVEDVLPNFLGYVPGTFMVDSVSVTPTIADGVISTEVSEGDHTITFDVIIDSVEATIETGTNWAYLKYDTDTVDQDSADITTYPYCGFHKVAKLLSAGDDMYIDLFENVVWEFRITVTNLFDWTMEDVVVTDRLAAELEIDGLTYITPGTVATWSRKGNVKLTWTIGDLAPSETATLILEVSTRVHKGKQAYTSSGCDYEFNSGATLKFKNPDGIQLSAHTGPMLFDVPGEWPHFQPYCVRYPETGNVYIGYEDWPDGDFDYNDFGMTFSFEEIYDENWNLFRVTMTFTAIIYDSGMDHLIHIERPINGPSVVTVTRPNPRPSAGPILGKDETPAGTHTFTGDVDVILFNTNKYTWPEKQMDEVVIVEITVVDPTLNPKDLALVPPRMFQNEATEFFYDMDAVMANYDPWEEGTLYGSLFHIHNIQSTFKFGSPAIDVPYILVVPFTDWIPPFESTLITSPYGYFDDFYRYGTQANWYDPSMVTNNWVGFGGLSWGPYP